MSKSAYAAIKKLKDRGGEPYCAMVANSYAKGIHETHEQIMSLCELGKSYVEQQDKVAPDCTLMNLFEVIFQLLEHDCTGNYYLIHMLEDVIGAKK